MEYEVNIMQPKQNLMEEMKPTMLDSPPLSDNSPQEKSKQDFPGFGDTFRPSQATDDISTHH